MASLNTLPTELRQRILSLALPGTMHFRNPPGTSVINLLHINHRLRFDMGPVIRLWRPIHYLSSPKQLPNLQVPNIPEPTSIPTLPNQSDRICLDIFPESSVEKIKWTCTCFDESNFTHYELVQAWTDAVPHLPANVNEIYIDITPIPETIRSGHRFVFNALLRDKRTLGFLSYHINCLVTLLQTIHSRFGDAVPVFLTGRLYEKSRYIIDKIQAQHNIEFKGTWLTLEELRWPSIQEAIVQIVPRLPKKGKGRASPHPLAKLRGGIAWSRNTRWLYAKLVDLGEEKNVVEDLRRIATFWVDEGVKSLKMEPSLPARRAFQHGIAKDLGVGTKSQGEGLERYVIVVRKPQAAESYAESEVDEV